MSSRLRDNPAVAHVTPLGAFLVFFALAPLFTVKNSQLPWWRSMPEHWIYPLQTLFCGGLLIYFWRNYTFAPLRGFGLATLLGLIGIILWVTPAWLYSHSGEHQA